jgi:uncharacterized membrane protein
MRSQQLADERIDLYMAKLQDALAGVVSSEREDILREIHAHIVESTASASDRDAAVDRILQLLGAPEELARRYSTEILLTRAGRSFSPLFLLRTCWSWAKLGMKGTVTFLLALFGYTAALALTVALFLKPFMPKIGTWVGNEGFILVGVPSHPERMHEVLGNYFIPVITVAAFGFAIGTTQMLRWIIRKRSSIPVRPAENRSSLRDSAASWS